MVYPSLPELWKGRILRAASAVFESQGRRRKFWVSFHAIEIRQGSQAGRDDAKVLCGVRSRLILRSQPCSRRREGLGRGGFALTTSLGLLPGAPGAFALVWWLSSTNIHVLSQNCHLQEESYKSPKAEAEAKCPPHCYSCVYPVLSSFAYSLPWALVPKG